MALHITALYAGALGFVWSLVCLNVGLTRAGRRIRDDQNEVHVCLTASSTQIVAMPSIHALGVSRAFICSKQAPKSTMERQRTRHCCTSPDVQVYKSVGMRFPPTALVVCALVGSLSCVGTIGDYSSVGLLLLALMEFNEVLSPGLLWW